MPEKLARKRSKLVYFLFGVLNRRIKVSYRRPRREDLQATVLALGEIQTYFGSGTRLEFASRISVRFLITYLPPAGDVEHRAAQPTAVLP